MGTKNLNENGPNPFVFFGTKNMVRVNLMAMVLCWHGFDNKSKLVYAGEIQNWNHRMEMTTYFSKQEGEICKSRGSGAASDHTLTLLLYFSAGDQTLTP